MGQILSAGGWKKLLANKECKGLSEPDLEKLIVQFEAAEKKADANAAETHLAKIKLKFRDLRKAHAKNRILIKWIDEAGEEADAFVASAAKSPDSATGKTPQISEKPKDRAEAPAGPKVKADKPKEAKTEDKKNEPASAREADAAAAPSKADAQREKLRETLTNELTLARRRARDGALKFVLNVDSEAPGLMLTRKELTPDLVKAAVFLTGKKGKTLNGLCYGESGKWVFVFPSEPSDILIRLLKKAALVHAGMKLKLKVIGGGVELDDGEAADPEDATTETGATAQASPDAGALTKELAALIPKIGPSAAGNSERLTILSTLAKDANAKIKGGKLTEAATAVARLRDELAKAAGGRAEAKAGAKTDGATTESTTDLKAAAAQWAGLQSKLEERLNEELKWIKSVASTKDPEVEKLKDLITKSELELRAVRANIKGDVSSRQLAIEMEKYLSEDDVVASVCEYTGFNLSPLLDALQPFKSLPA